MRTEEEKKAEKEARKKVRKLKRENPVEVIELMGGGYGKDKMMKMGHGGSTDYMKKKMKMGGKTRYKKGGRISCPVNGMAHGGLTKGKMV